LPVTHQPMTFYGMILMTMHNPIQFCMINYKGGTGKTCTLVNLAYGMSLKNYRILIIDTDPQGSISYHFGLKPIRTLYDVIVGNQSPQACITPARTNIDVIASGERLYPAEHHMHLQPNREFILKNALESIMATYDYTFIDCSPSINLINQNAILCAPNLLIPVSMDYMTLLGVKQLITNAKLLNKYVARGIRVAKIIPTFYNIQNRKTKNVFESLENVFPGEISSPIRANVSVSEAAGAGKTLMEYAPLSSAVDDFNKLIEEVLQYER
jgi:chromosome partitioning protein